MLRQLLDRARGVWRSEDQTSEEAREDRDDGSRSAEGSVPSETSGDSTHVSRKIDSAIAAAPTKYPLSWPARDLARSRRLQSQETMIRNQRRKSGSAEEPDSDPTVVWRPTDGGSGDGR